MKIWFQNRRYKTKRKLQQDMTSPCQVPQARKVAVKILMKDDKVSDLIFLAIFFRGKRLIRISFKFLTIFFCSLLPACFQVIYNREEVKPYLSPSNLLLNSFYSYYCWPFQFGKYPPPPPPTGHGHPPLSLTLPPPPPILQ